MSRLDTTRRQCGVDMTQEIPEGVPAGWYPDGSGQQRYWNGAEWTKQFLPLPPPPPQPPISLPAGWYTDSTGSQRYWDGMRWTKQVAAIATPAVEAAQSGPIPRSQTRSWDFSKLGSFRFWIGCAIIAFIPAFAVLQINPNLGWLFDVFLARTVTSGLAYGVPLNCPHCRKRIKAGANICHHCGQSVHA